jgi:hypothetical protein
LLEILDQADDGNVDIATESAVVALHLGVAVPLAAGSVIELDEAHSAFDETSGHETLSSIDLGVLVIQSVEILDVFRFAIEIDGLGGLGLHAEGEFVASDASLEVRVVLPGIEMVVVELLKKVELLSLAFVRDVLRIVQVLNGLAAVFEEDPLVDRGDETGTPGTGSVHDHGIGILDHDKTGQALVLRSEAVRNP